MNNKLRKLFNKQVWAAWLFWSWNLIFLAFMFLGFAPIVLPDMVTAVQANDIPTQFLIYAAVLTLIPAAAVIVGFIWLRREPKKLFALGYGVEGPLMLVLAVRFFIVRQSTPAVALILITAGLGVLAYLWPLLDKKIEQRGSAVAHLRFVGLTLLLIVGLYASVWIMFYVIPFIGQLGNILRDIGGSLWYGLTHWNWQNIEWRMVPFFILYFPLMVYTATLFVLMPVAVSILYTRAWLESVRALAGRYQRTRVLAVLATGGQSLAVLLILALLLIQTDKQPQRHAFALLETPPDSLAAAQELLADEEAIRDGLLNAYLAPNRYVSAQGEMDHIKWMYTDTFDITEKQAQGVQRLYEGVARPILYKPVNPPEAGGNRWENRVFRTEPAEAAELYEDYFDEPIVDGEHEAVINAVRSTWMADQARANWQAVDDREILLTQQELNIVEHGDWAEVELYEVYQNQTRQRQEVVYYFSLPETAVITGIWLNDSEERDSRFPYRVAPRGAAQAVYQSQVRRRIDPALVEQIGPSQYRFRIFPVEPMGWDWDDSGRRTSTLVDGPPMHMWLTYSVMANGDGWPLPYLAEKRNVYWNDDTVRLINGADMADVDEGIWLPEKVTAVTPPQPTSHQVNFNGQTVRVEPITAVNHPTASSDLRMAVILDRSRSMGSVAKEVENSLRNLSAWGTVDLYLTASELRGEEPSRTTLSDFDITDILYFGGQNAAELLLQFDSLRQDETYDIILVLTDGTGYELDDGEVDIPVPDAPLWMVHVDGRFPLGYGDATLEAIQASGGGTVGSIDEALTRLLVKNGDIVDGYLWTIEEIELEGELEDGFAPIAARQFILAQTAAERASIGELTTLDALHDIAVEQGIVTPYSSMIVLVTERQQKLLDEAEAEDDRFEREYEEIGETDQAMVTGVPEPEEWLLIGLALAMLGWYWVNGRRKPQLT